MLFKILLYMYVCVCVSTCARARVHRRKKISEKKSYSNDQPLKLKKKDFVTRYK